MAPIRKRWTDWVERKLRAYDAQDLYNRPEDEEYGSRDGYEVHVRCEALREIRSELETVAMAGPEHGAVGRYGVPIVIVALLAVHISTEHRLERFRHTLRSITQQQLDPFDAELVLAVSWHSPDPNLAEQLQGALRDFAAERRRVHTVLCQEYSSNSKRTGGALSADVHRAPVTVLVRQAERHTQFQHHRAALIAVESVLRQRWHFRPGDEGHRSVWTIFSDDDDLWHRRRVSEYVRAIRTHPMLDGVACFATTSRAIVVTEMLREGDKMPESADGVDSFILRGRAARMQEDENVQDFRDELRRAGSKASLLPVPDGMPFEYFDFCPRLRVLREFFESTSPSVLAHRFCDLRLVEFLQAYPRLGKEVGLELRWIEPSCWMYFYANAGPDLEQFCRSIEDGDENTISAGHSLAASHGHVSLEVKVTPSDLTAAERALHNFQDFDPNISLARLSRYMAAFRSNVEVDLVRRHTCTRDQRVFDAVVFMAAQGSFVGFAAHLEENAEAATAERASLMVYESCQDYAKELAETLGVEVVWREKGLFLMPQDLDFLGDLGAEMPWGPDSEHHAFPWPGKGVAAFGGHQALPAAPQGEAANRGGGLGSRRALEDERPAKDAGRSGGEKPWPWAKKRPQEKASHWLAPPADTWGRASAGPLGLYD